MNELESILNYLETTSLEPHNDYTSEFAYKEQKILWNYIKQLQQKLQQKEDIINKAKEYIINNSLYEEEYDYDYEENIYLSGIHDDVRRILVEILDNKGDEK